jgi:hypothetical protein
MPVGKWENRRWNDVKMPGAARKTSAHIGFPRIRLGTETAVVASDPMIETAVR